MCVCTGLYICIGAETVWRKKHSAGVDIDRYVIFKNYLDFALVIDKILADRFRRALAGRKVVDISQVGRRGGAVGFEVGNHPATSFRDHNLVGKVERSVAECRDCVDIGIGLDDEQNTTQYRPILQYR